ncbi:DNA-processing protein DprA [Patescibacteria group bacterium]|nr:DNA-processing protein DprA [Patescibacteria group bacterium]
MTNLTEERLYYLAWSWFYKVGPTKINQLTKKFGSLTKAWHGSTSAFNKLGWEEKLIADFLTYRQSTEPSALKAKLQQLNIDFCTPLDKAYPDLLKQICSPPTVIYYQGDITILSKRCLAIVGSRRPTAYGQRLTEELASAAARAGLTIVSGLAYGIDAIAHLACLKQNGSAAAVLAGGLDDIYPKINYHLAQKIIDCSGLLLSEYPPGTPSLKQHFPLRNRLIAGLSQAILITEAAANSGSLITARLGLDYNREIAAVPGSIYSALSQGCLELIKQGAKTICSTKDLLEIFNLVASDHQPTESLTLDEEKFLKDLPLQSLPLKQIMELTGQSASQVLANLSVLEIKGYIKSLDGENFSRLY